MFNRPSSQSRFEVPLAVDVGAPTLQNSSVIFHGVNKSGSWAMSEVLQDAYRLDHRTEEFMCRYFGIPSDRQEALDRFQANLGKPQILIDHNLVGISGEVESAQYITLLRHPVKRLISCYFWLAKHHPKAVGDRSLIQWARVSGHSYSLSFQFACHDGASDHFKTKVKALPKETMAAKGRKWFDSRIAAFGVSECFEESVMWLASALGIRQVPIWQPDTRNETRPKWDLVDPQVHQELNLILDYDIEFYNDMKVRFLDQTKLLRSKSVVQKYVDSCANSRVEQAQYGANVRATMSAADQAEKNMADGGAEMLKELAKRLERAKISSFEAPASKDLQLITEGLPSWWTTGNNKFYVDRNHAPKKLPSITHPATKHFPKNTLLIARTDTIPSLQIWGDGGTIFLSQKVSLPQSRIVCGDGASIHLGTRTRSTAATTFDARNGGVIAIEGDCLIAGGCRFMTDDMHAILDAKTKKRINPFGGRIVIHAHVWLGLEALVTGGADIGKHSIVGARSFINDVVQPGVVVAGVPARVIRTGVTWDAKDIPP
jgi:acetyltransferase-like isoleucine patch superfamily enzyme